MSAPKPHFLLFSEARRRPASEPDTGSQPVAVTDSGAAANGKWRFVLESLDSGKRLEVSDEEREAGRDRLDLLAVVRGLEALDQPSRVTLVTPSRYVTRGLRYGLPQWRENQWRWERFGKLAPINNSDLWRRIDGALRYHTIDCRMWRYDPAAEPHESGAVACRDTAIEPINESWPGCSAQPAARKPVAPRRGRLWPRLTSAARRFMSNRVGRYCPSAGAVASAAH